MLSGGFPRPPGTGLPRGVPKDVSPTNQAPTAVPATRPRVPRRGRSVSSKYPAPGIEIRYSDVSRQLQKPLSRSDRSCRLHTAPLHISQFRYLSRRTHLELRLASQAAQGHSTQAHRDGAEGSTLVKATWKRKAREGLHMRR